MRRFLRGLYHYICWQVWRSPLAYLFVPLDLTIDDLTEQVIRCRVVFEARKAVGNAEPSQIQHWEQRLEQMEWEHVRRLQRAGKGDDPFVCAKMERPDVADDTARR